MAIREFYIGSFGPFLYDDSDSYEDAQAHRALYAPLNDDVEIGKFSWTDGSGNVWTLSLKVGWIKLDVLDSLGSLVKSISILPGEIVIRQTSPLGGLNEFSVDLDATGNHYASAYLIEGSTGKYIELRVDPVNGQEIYFDGVKILAGGTGAIQHSIIDAKGDLLAGTANDTIARLPVGSNGDFLTPASGESTGLKWQTPGPASGNIPKNGALLGNSQIVETDGSGNLVSAVKNTAYNKNFGTSAGTVSEGNHDHTGVYEQANPLSGVSLISTDMSGDANDNELKAKINEIINTLAS